MARVLIYSLVFPPDGVSTAQLYGEIAEDLQKAGHEVSVITTLPHYNRDLVAESTQPITALPSWRGLLYQSEFRGIRVLHTRMPADGRQGIVRRLQGWFGFHVIGLLAALTVIPAPRVILVPSPLLTAGITAWIIGVLKGGRYIYNVQELYPDLAIEMGRVRNPVMIRLLRALECLVYRLAGATTGISHEICARLIQRGVPPAKVHMIPNFVDPKDLAPLPKDNSFSRELGLTRTFVVSYVGNMGLAQDLDTLLRSAALLQFDNDLRLLLVGDGVYRDTLKQEACERELENVIFVAHQPYARVPEIYAASDVCLVPLLDSVAGSALPSKVFRIMACSRPIVAVCHPGSELAGLVRTANAGLVVSPGRPEEFVAAVRELQNDRPLRAAMGAAGRRFALERYSRERVTAQYADLVRAVAGG